MRPRHRAACGLLGSAILWEIFAADDELLSHAADDARTRWPKTIWAAVIFTALHLLRVLPSELDPFVGPPVSWFRVGPIRPYPKRSLDDGRNWTTAQTPERPRSH
jgi:hypothetical protein